MKTISIINQKGGVGKSTTAEALAGALSLKGYKVLAVDLDAQGNLSKTAGADMDGATILEVLTGGIPAEEVRQRSKSGSFDVLPASRMLSAADKLLESTGKEYKLREALEPVSKDYDFTVIDTPPVLGILTINALTASYGVVIPAEADIDSLEGIAMLAETIKPVKKYCNSELRILGVLLTKYSGRSVVTRELKTIAEDLARQLDTKVFSTPIRYAEAPVREAHTLRTNLLTHAPRAKVTQDYIAFTDELLEDLKK